MPVLKTYLLALALTLMLALIAGRALGHGDANWIMMRDPYCCGPTDCSFLPLTHRVAPTTQGFVFEWAGREVTVPYWMVKPSIDDHYWLCVNPDQTMRCFYAPPVGS